MNSMVLVEIMTLSVENMVIAIGVFSGSRSRMKSDPFL